MQAGELCLVSAYMPHDDEVEVHTVMLRRILAEASRRKYNVIIGSDANSRHTVWESSEINGRGDSPFNFICNEDPLY